MDIQRKISLKHTLFTIVGATGVIGPEILAEFNSAPNNKWARVGIRVLGAFVLFCVNGKAVKYLNLLFPDPKPEVAVEAPKEVK
jgi:hypothetical protein